MPAVQINNLPDAAQEAGDKVVTIKTDGAAELVPAVGGVALTDGDKGDITVSAGGTSWQIDASAVGQTELASNAVSSAKIVNGAVTDTKLHSSITNNINLGLSVQAATGIATTKIWRGTQAAYDALTPASDTLYFISG